MTNSPPLCNCPWMGCPSHKGSLCRESALVEEPCGGCGEVHHFGDGIIAEGLHLCQPCVEDYGKLLIAGTFRVMVDCTAHCPSRLDPLNHLLADYWAARRGAAGWRELRRDVRAMMAFVSCFMGDIDDVSVLLRVKSHAEAVRDFELAFEAKRIPGEEASET